MSLVYVVSVLMLIISSLLLKRNDKKIDLIKTLTINLVLFLCYQTFIAYVYSMINIPITLVTLTIINTCIFIVFLVKIICTKEIQKYQISKQSLVFIFFLVWIIGIITYLDFGIPFNIKYLTTDSAVHYLSAKEFYESDKLLLKEENTLTSNAMMPGAYSNIGILFKTFAPYIGEINLYKIFIGFDIFVLFLSGLLFFETIKKYCKNDVGYLIAGIISIIYLLGYPLNNLLFGYFYLGLGVLVINAIINVMQDFTSSKENIVSIFLLCFELFFSYYLFVPAVYGALFIFYIIYFCKSTKKWINKKMLLFIAFTLVLPCILGFCYNVLPGLLSDNQIQVTTIIQTEGYIYRNLYSNLLLFIPFVIYYLIKENKEKKINFDIIIFMFFIIYMCILYISIFKLNISTYYFFKTYFVLWQLVIYLFFRGICYAIEEKKIAKYIVSFYIGIYILLMVLSFKYNKVPIIKDKFNKNENITDVMDIFGINKTVLYDVQRDYTVEELDILKYANNIKLNFENNNTLIIGDQRQEFWFWAIFEYKFKENLSYETTTNNVYDWNNGKYEYLILFNRSGYYQDFKNILNSEHEVIYENKSGAILKY